MPTLAGVRPYTVTPAGDAVGARVEDDPAGAACGGHDGRVFLRPAESVERTTFSPAGATQFTATFMTFAVPIVPAPLVTVQRSLASIAWTCR